MFHGRILSFAAVVCLVLSAVAGADTAVEDLPLGQAELEFSSGAKVKGKLTGVQDGNLSVVTTIGTRELTREYPADRIQAVTVAGTRYVLKTDAAPMPAGPRLPSASSSGRSKVDVQKIIDEVGRTAPEWYASVELNYPRSLDLSWPMPPPTSGWNNQRNVGQYIWDILNPNPGRWKSAIRFMHFMLERHADNPEVRTRVMQRLGGMYFDYFQDYARAAFWWQQAKVVESQSPQAVRLAECYWRIGDRQKAIDLLGAIPAHYGSIKLWADMGETDKALRVAGRYARSGFDDMVYLSAGDACRTVGDLDKAIQYYGSVLKISPSGRMAKRIQRNHERARANIEAIKLYDALDLSRVPDGKYRGRAAAYAGELHIEVTVSGGRIVTVVVTQHKEKQFYSAINDTTKQIVQEQGFTGIDATTGATITSEAIINATAKALAGASR